MTISIELNPEMEAQLAVDARSRGLAIERYAQSLLREAMSIRPTVRSRASREEFRDFLDAMRSEMPSASHLREDTFSRAMIYEDAAKDDAICGEHD